MFWNRNVFLSALVLSSLFLLVSCDSGKVVAKLVKTDGVVKVNGKAALAGAELRSGDRVEAPGRSFADIEFTSGHKTRLLNGKVQITEKGQATSLRLSEGKLFVAVKKLKSDETLTIYTPSSVAGVRGTQFVIEEKKAGGGTYLGVVEGAVETSVRGDRKKSVTVKKNQDILIEVKKPLPIPKNNPALTGQVIKIFGEMGVLKPTFKSRDDDSGNREMSGGLR